MFGTLITPASSLAILILLTSHTSLFARPTCQLQGDLTMSTYNLLRDMGRRFPDQCLLENLTFSATFPSASFVSSDGSTLQCAQVSPTIYHTLCEIEELWKSFELPDQGRSWGEATTEHFQNILYRQVEDGRCLLLHAGSSTEDLEAVTGYFGSLADILRKTAGSMCGWEIVREQQLYVLKFVLQHNQVCFSWS